MKHLTDSEQEEAVSFYQEFAEDARIVDYEEMVRRFGEPRKLAAAIYAETAGKVIRAEKDEKKEDVGRGFLMGLAALFAFPFSISAVMALSAISLALVVSLGSILLSFLVVSFAIAASGIWSLIRSFFYLIPFEAGPFLMSVGGFLILTPVGILLLRGVWIVIRKLMKIITTLISDYIQRRTNHES